MGKTIKADKPAIMLGIEQRIREFLANPTKELKQAISVDFYHLDILIDAGEPCSMPSKPCRTCQYRIETIGPRGGRRQHCWMKYDFYDKSRAYDDLSLAEAHLYLSETLHIFADWENRYTK